MKPLYAAFLLLSPILLWAQETPNIKVDAIKTHVSANRDSIYIQGLENSLRIEFEPVDSIFEYRLKGHDNQWKSSIFPVASYGNLSGGHYLFEYKLDGHAFSPIKVNVLEALWQKWWFWPMIGGYILLLGGVGTFLFFQYNYRQKLKVAHLRNQIAADLHDEVGSNLSSIAIYTEVLRKKLGQNQPDLLPLLDKITGNSAESVTLMRDTVWTLRPGNDTMAMVVDRISSFGKEVLAERQISFTQHIEVDLSKIRMDMQTRKNSYLILKEALNNIAKHADARHASLHVFQKSGKLWFQISDDGKGFDPSQIMDGNGLKNFKERAEESDFEIDIKSEINRGTQVTLVISP